MTHAGEDRDDAGAMLDMDGLFRAEAPRLRRWLSARTRDPEAANDMVQETFLRLSASEPVKGIRNPAAWLQRVARNLLIDKARRERSRHAHYHLPLDEAIDLPVAPDQAQMIEAADLVVRYEHAISGLTERTRQVFLMHRVDGFTYREIAGRLAITTATVEYHVMRALTHIDRELDDA